MIKYFILITLIPTLTSIFFKDMSVSVINYTERVSIYGADNGDGLGISVSSAGDINGDGIDDLLAGAFGTNPLGRNNAGAVYVIYGKQNGFTNLDLKTDLANNTLGFSIFGVDPNDCLGFSGNKAGDVNGDGIDDIIVGSRFIDPLGRTDAGAVYVIFGRKNGFCDIDLKTDLVNNTLGFRISGSSAGDFLGVSVSGAGDTNGDEISDIIVGAHLADPYGRLDAGTAYVVYGRKNGIVDINLSTDLNNNTLGYRIAGMSLGEELGISVNRAGDVNGDCIDDVIIGAHGSQPKGRLNAGTAYVVYGKKSRRTDIDLINNDLVSNAEGFRIFGAAPDDRIAFSISCAGDINGDQVDDILVGAPNFDPFGRTNAGAAYVIYGKKTRMGDIDLSVDLVNNTLGFKISGNTPGDNLGASVSGAGDINGDNVDDIIIGAPNASATALNKEGVAYILYGRKNGHIDLDMSIDLINNTLGFSIFGANPSGSFGYSVNNAGDVNGDNATDIIVGAHDATVLGISGAGATYVILGTKPSVSTDSKAEYSLINTLVNLMKSASYFSTIATFIINLIKFTNPVPACLNTALSGLLYIKYLNIRYSPQLEYFLDLTHYSWIYSISIFFSIPKSIRNDITRHTLPDIFRKRDMDSSFLVNFWSWFFTIAIVLALVIIFCLLECCTRKRKALQVFFQKSKYFLRSNYLIITLTGCCGEISLYTSLEMRTLHFENFLEWFSFFVCIFANLLVILITVRMIVVISKLNEAGIQSRETRKPEYLIRAQKKFKGYEIVFESFKNNSFVQQVFLIIFSVKQYMFYFVLGYLFEYALIQMLAINALGFGMLGYIFMKRSPKSKVDLIGCFIQESIFQVVHLSALVLAIVDSMEGDTNDIRELIGNVIIGCYSVFQIFNFLYLCLMVVIIVKNAYESFKEWFYKDRRGINHNRIRKYSNTNIPKLNNFSHTNLLEQSKSVLTDLNETVANVVENKEQSQDRIVNAQSLGKILIKENLKIKPLNRPSNQISDQKDFSPNIKNALRSFSAGYDEENMRFDPIKLYKLKQYGHNNEPTKPKKNEGLDEAFKNKLSNEF